MRAGIVLYESIRVVLARAAVHNMEIMQFEVKQRRFYTAI
jgi:hypothetical protein